MVPHLGENRVPWFSELFAIIKLLPTLEMFHLQKEPHTRNVLVAMSLKFQ